jgi:DNA-binding FadR family transcriptional regulator
LAATRASRADLARIDRAYHDMDAAVPLDRPMDVDAFVDADTRFHTAILQAAGNDILEQLAHVVAVALRASFEITSRIPGSARATLPRHRAVLAAIRGGRPKPAAAAMRTLVKSIDRLIERQPEKPEKGEKPRRPTLREARQPVKSNAKRPRAPKSR